MGATLRIWRPTPGNVGHVSLEVDGVYMSYWPGERAKAKKDFKIGADHEPMMPRGYRHDRLLEKKACDDSKVLRGLHHQRMKDAWNALLQDPGRYNMVRHNCSTIVAALLEAGSGRPPDFCPRIRIDDYVQSRISRVFLRLRFLGSTVDMWTPEQVWRYAQSLEHPGAAR